MLPATAVEAPSDSLRSAVCGTDLGSLPVAKARLLDVQAARGVEAVGHEHGPDPVGVNDALQHEGGFARTSPGTCAACASPPDRLLSGMR